MKREGMIWKGQEAISLSTLTTITNPTQTRGPAPTASTTLLPPLLGTRLCSRHALRDRRRRPSPASVPAHQMGHLPARRHRCRNAPPELARLSARSG